MRNEGFSFSVSTARLQVIKLSFKQSHFRNINFFFFRFKLTCILTIRINLCKSTTVGVGLIAKYMNRIYFIFFMPVCKPHFIVVI